MASRQNPNAQRFFSAAAPSVNFFASVDDETSDPALDRDAAEQELADELRAIKADNGSSGGEADDGHGSAYGERMHQDSESFDNGPFSPGAGTSGHVVSSPYELSHYPIEIQESKRAMQRQMQKARLESSKDALTGLTSPSANTPSTELNSLCVSPKSPSRNSLEVLAEPATARKDAADSAAGLLQQQHEAGREALSAMKLPQVVEMHTFRDAVDVNYQRMAIAGEELSGVPLEDTQAAARFLIEGMRLRMEYMGLIGNFFPSTTKSFLTGHYPQHLPKCRKKNTESSAHTSYNPPEPPLDHWGLATPLPTYEKRYQLKRVKGTIAVLEDDGAVVEELRRFYVPREKFLNDYRRLITLITDGPLKSFCYRRLTFLQYKFQLHVLLNEIRELHEQKSVPHRDFYNIRKVDTHIHASSSMNQKHMLRFIKKKLRTEGDVAVHEQNGEPITLRQLFERLGLGTYDMSVDMLDVHADRNTFHRFDKFNTKYNPVGQNTLREVFLKIDNFVGGKYYAEVLKEVFSDLEDSKYQQAEPRISIYGRSRDEWDSLAKWAIRYDVWSPNVRWIVQIPRLFDVYMAKRMLANFDEFLDNVFTPLFEVTNDPSSHPELHRFLQYVTGLDSVDDESKHEHNHFDHATPEPLAYTDGENPTYSYYLYYLYANLAALNAFRRMRGLNTFALRTHSGEAGHPNHLIAAYLTTESVAHGLLLRKVPVLQYLFYLSQVGIAMSPLSNNSLFISYPRNPLPEYLMKGLNVSLSTDDPLQFHFTKEALMEEYSIAAQVWKLSSCDMCELARNSVLQSGFEDSVKIHWLGPNYKEEGVLGNDCARTNVPDIRVSFRHEALVDELVNLFASVAND